jgi:hypothetical protein
MLSLAETSTLPGNKSVKSMGHSQLESLGVDGLKGIFLLIPLDNRLYLVLGHRHPRILGRL